MNKVIQIGRIVAKPETRYTQGNEPMAVSRYTLAVDRKYKKDGEQNADFIRCVSFGKNGEFAEKYFEKGMKVAIVGHIQTGSYKDKDGKTVYTTDVVVDEQEFCESKKNSDSPAPSPAQQTDESGFFSVGDGDESDLPFL